jgi:phospholipase/carboxylesterase
MTNPDLTLAHRFRPPLNLTARPPLLILLHGVGSNEHDLFGLAPQLDPRFAIVSARAPNTRAPGSYAWFDVAFTPRGPVIDAGQAEASRQQLIRFIGAACAAYRADPGRVYLMGFSQGAIMSASIALTRPELTAGAVLMSGRILPEIGPLIAPAEKLAGLPFLVVHGTEDPVLPVHHGRASRTLLTSLPVRLDYHEYAMGHTIGAQSLETVTTWLRHELDRPVLPQQASQHQS